MGIAYETIARIPLNVTKVAPFKQRRAPIFKI
jgi:hypothetical protein